MISKIKLFKWPLFFFVLIIILALVPLDDYPVARISHGLYIMGLFALTDLNLKHRLFWRQDAQSAPLRGLTFLNYGAGLLAGLTSSFLLTYNIKATIVEPYYKYLVGALIVLNIILVFMTTDWKAQGTFREIALFFMKFLLFLFLHYTVFLIVGIGFSKTGVTSVFNRIILQLWTMGIGSVVLLLISPKLPVKERLNVHRLIGFTPALFSLVFVLASLLSPSPLRSEHYIQYLEDKQLWAQGQLQPNPHLSLEERQEFIDYSRRAAGIQQPDTLKPITNYFNSFNISDLSSAQAEADFIRAVGFSPKTLWTSYELWNEFPNTSSHIFLDDQDLADVLSQDINYVQEIHLNMEDSLEEANSQSITFNNRTYSLHETFAYQPDQYEVSLMNEDGQKLARIPVFDLFELGLKKSEAKDPSNPQDLIFPFNNGGQSGYLVVSYMGFTPLNRDTNLRLLLAIRDASIQSEESKVIIDDDKMWIHGDYQTIISFSDSDFTNHTLNEEFIINQEAYLLSMRSWDYSSWRDNPYLEISIDQLSLEPPREPVFHLEMTQGDREDVFKQAENSYFESESYQADTFDFELLLYQDPYGSTAGVNGFLFISSP